MVGFNGRRLPGGCAITCVFVASGCIGKDWQEGKETGCCSGMRSSAGRGLFNVAQVAKHLLGMEVIVPASVADSFNKAVITLDGVWFRG